MPDSDLICLADWKYAYDTNRPRTAEQRTGACPGRWPTQPMKWHSTWLVALLLFATALRLGGLGVQELSGDEAFSVGFAAPSPAEIASETLRLGEPHPPLYYAVLHAWMAIAGDSEFALRFLSAAAGILAVALIFAFVRQLFGCSAAFAAATFMAINPFQIWYAQTSRMYAISTALALLATLLLWAGLRRNRWWHWVLYSLLTAAHLYLHYYALLILLAQGIWVLAAERHRWRRVVNFISAAGGAALLFSPWLIRALPSINAYQGNVESPTLSSMLVQSLLAFSLGETIQPKTATPFLAAFGLLFVFGLWYAVRAKRREAVLLTLWLFVPLAGTWVASLQRPIFTVRYVISASPSFYIFLGLGTVALARKWSWRATLAGFLVTVCLAGIVLSLVHYYASSEYTTSRGWREVVSYVESNAAEGDLLIQNYPDPSLSYYLRDRMPLIVLPERYGDSSKQIEQTLTDLTSQHRRIWFLPYPNQDWDSTGIVGQWLEHNTDLIDKVELGSMRLEAYLALRVSLEQMSVVEAQLGKNIRLLGYRLEGEARPGKTLQLTLYWEALGATETDYTVFAHLVGAGDTMLGQMDHQPLNGAAPTSTWTSGQRLADRYEINIRDDAPTGRARLLVGMYDPATAERLPATGPVDEFNRIYLASVHIAPTP